MGRMRKTRNTTAFPRTYQLVFSCSILGFHFSLFCNCWFAASHQIMGLMALGHLGWREDASAASELEVMKSKWNMVLFQTLGIQDWIYGSTLLTHLFYVEFTLTWWLFPDLHCMSKVDIGELRNKTIFSRVSHWLPGVPALLSSCFAYICTKFQFIDWLIQCRLSCEYMKLGECIWTPWASQSQYEMVISTPCILH